MDEQVPGSDFTQTFDDLRRFRGGDFEAFAILWRRVAPRVAVLIRGKLHAVLEPNLRARLQEELEDILQEVATVAFRRLPSFHYEGRGAFLAWLGEIASNVISRRRKYWSADRRTPSREQATPNRGTWTETGSWSVALPASDTGPSAIVSTSEERARMIEALALLSDEEHVIVYSRFFAEAEWGEIARLVGSTEDAVRVRCCSTIVPRIIALMRASAPA